MRCKIAAHFGKFPFEVEALPLHEYRLMRNYVLAIDEEMRDTGKPKDELETESWGDSTVASAPWSVDSVTGMGT
jgi:hypothetical protein